jgi:hypothetical protein
VPLQRSLIAGLETVGDVSEAARVASQAWNECPVEERSTADGVWIAASVLRLALAAPAGASRVEANLVADAVAGGAVIEIEARV